MTTATLTSKGQITLPKTVRDRLALRQGDLLRVAVDAEGRVTLERERLPRVEQLYGLLQRLAGPRPATVAEMHAAVRRRARRKHAGERP